MKYAARTMRQNPGFTLIAIVTLALGIGANTTIFSVINAVLLRPLPYKDPSRLVMLAESMAAYPVLSVSHENYEDWRDQSTSFQAIGAVQPLDFTLTGSGDPERLTGQMISASTFPMLGVQPALGREYTSAEDRAGGAPVVLLSYALWQRRYAGSADVLGKSLTLDNNPYTVIGVMPAGFQIFREADVILPLEPWAKTLPDDRNWHTGIVPVARLKDSVTIEQARLEMRTIAKRLEQQYPLYDTGIDALVLPLQGQIVSNVRPALLTLLAAVGLVLLIACANVANLLLARASQREKEIAIRSALGASRARLVRQLLTESVMIAAIGGALGLALAAVGLGPLLHFAAATVPRAEGIGLNSAVLGFTAALAILTGIVFGLVPALQASRFDIRDQLNQNSRGSTGGTHHQRLRSALVIAEVAISMVLLIGAGLLIRSFARMQSVAPGFRSDHLLLAELPLSPTKYAKPEQQIAFFDRLLERMRALPGASHAIAANFMPMSGYNGLIHFNIQERPPKSPHDFILTGYYLVSPDYFEALGIPVLAGRTIRQSDNFTSPSVVVINQTMAKRFFPGENPLGKRLQIGELPETSIPFMEVIGIVGDVKQKLDSDAVEAMYVPYMQPVLPLSGLTVGLRTSQDPASMASAMRSAVFEIDRDQPIVKIRTMDQAISTSMNEPKFRTLLLTLLAVLALILSAVGVYGVMSYSVSLRTQEIGIRLAMGAQFGDVMALVVRQGFALAAMGIVVGGIAAYALSRLMARFLFGVGANDPATFAGVSLLLAAVALLACYVPARRATRVDPLVALRCD
jgi:putative ABC transport system permease protein